MDTIEITMTKKRNIPPQKNKSKKHNFKIGSFIKSLISTIGRILCFIYIGNAEGAKGTNNNSSITQTPSLPNSTLKCRGKVKFRANDVFIGSKSGSEGKIKTNEDYLHAEVITVGGAGRGKLTLSERGEIISDSIVIGQKKQSEGVLNIGSSKSRGKETPFNGTLDVQTIHFGKGKGTLNFNSSLATNEFLPTLTGSGSLNFYSGSHILTTSNTFDGHTYIHEGTVQIGNGETKGRLGGKIINHSKIIFDRSDDIFYKNISGTGALVKRGKGELTLGKKSTYSGLTTVQAGKLKINDTLNNSPIIVKRGAVLEASGEIKSLSSNGITSLGEKNRKLIVNENTSFKKNHTLICTIDDQSKSDSILIKGQAHLGGKLSIILNDNLQSIPFTYTLLTSATPITTQFDSVSIFPQPLDYNLIYTPDKVILDINNKDRYSYSAKEHKKIITKDVLLSPVKSPKRKLNDSLISPTEKTPKNKTNDNHSIFLSPEKDRKDFTTEGIEEKKNISPNILNRQPTLLPSQISPAKKIATPISSKTRIKTSLRSKALQPRKIKFFQKEQVDKTLSMKSRLSLDKFKIIPGPPSLAHEEHDKEILTEIDTPPVLNNPEEVLPPQQQPEIHGEVVLPPEVIIDPEEALPPQREQEVHGEVVLPPEIIIDLEEVLPPQREQEVRGEVILPEVIIDHEEVLLPQQEQEGRGEVILPEVIIDLEEVLPPQQKQEVHGEVILPPEVIIDHEEVLMPQQKQEVHGEVILPPKVIIDHEEVLMPQQEQQVQSININLNPPLNSLKIAAASSLSKTVKSSAPQKEIVEIQEASPPTQVICKIPLAEILAVAETGYISNMFSEYNKERRINSSPHAASAAILMNHSAVSLEESIAQTFTKKTLSFASETYFSNLPKNRPLPQNFRGKLDKFGYWIQTNTTNFQDNLARDNSSTMSISADTWSTNLGVDYKFKDNLILGLITGYSNSTYNVTKDNSEGKVSSYLFGGYGAWLLSKNWHFNTFLIYGYHSINDKETILGVQPLTPDKRYGHNVTAGIESGYDFSLPHDYILSPYVGIEAFYFHEKSHQKWQASIKSTTIFPSRNTSFIQNKIGAQISKMWVIKGIESYGFIKLGYIYRQVLNISRINNQKDAVKFSTFDHLTKDYHRHLCNFGVGATALLNKSIYITFAYEKEVGPNQKVKRGLLKIEWKI